MSKRKPDRAARAHKLLFAQIDREVQSHAGETIYQAARRSGVRIIGACGGRGTCGTCRILIVEGKVDASPTRRRLRLHALARRRIGCAPARSNRNPIACWILPSVRWPR
jgi:ferredoxin